MYNMLFPFTATSINCTSYNIQCSYLEIEKKNHNTSYKTEFMDQLHVITYCLGLC